MIPQTFRGRSIEDARRSAATALGPSAIVLASRRLPKPGFFGLLGATEFEVTAAAKDIDFGPALTERRNPFAEATRLGANPPSGTEQIRNDIRAEIRALRGLIASQRTDSKETESYQREIAELRSMVDDLTNDLEVPAKRKRRVAALGLEGAAERALSRAFKGMPGEPDEAELRAALRDIVTTSPWPLPDSGRALIALVGPTGVGKTTTCAKLAARAILEQQQTVTLVTCDGYRVGAEEQMGRFASLLGAEFVVVRDRASLTAAVDGARTDVVIVDTAGRGPAEPDGIEAALSRLRPRASLTRHTLLCVPAALRDVDARSIGKFFAPCRPTGLVVTKLDETSSPVGLLHASAATKLGIAALCFGQRVPDDIAPATADAVIDHLLGHAASARAANATKAT